MAYGCNGRASALLPSRDGLQCHDSISYITRPHQSALWLKPLGLVRHDQTGFDGRYQQFGRSCSLVNKNGHALLCTSEG